MKDTDKYQLPGDFRWPTEREYATYTTDAYRQLGFDSDFVRTKMAPPLQSQVNGMVASLEAYTGESIHQLSGKLFGDKGASVAGASASKVAALTFGLMNGQVMLAAQAGADLAAQVGLKVAEQIGTKLASQVAAVIPIVGQMVSMVISFLGPLLEGVLSPEEKKLAMEAAAKQLMKEMPGRCGKWAENFAPTGTGVGGSTTPADIFRGVFLSAQIGGPLPPTLAGLYVCLCGAESQGVGYTRREWDFVHAKAQSAGGVAGIDPATQRRMWGLCKAIMFAAMEPRTKGQIQVYGDAGFSAFGALQEIVRREHELGNWNLPYIKEVSKLAGENHVETISADVGKYASGVVITACGTWYGLEHQLERNMLDWRAELKAKFCDYTPHEIPGQVCKFRATASAQQLKSLIGGGAKFELVLSASSVASLVGAADDAEKRQDQSGALATAAKLTVAGGALYALAKYAL